MIENPCNQDLYSEAPIMNAKEFYFIFLAAIHNFFLIFFFFYTCYDLRDINWSNVG